MPLVTNGKRCIIPWAPYYWQAKRLYYLLILASLFDGFTATAMEDSEIVEPTEKNPSRKANQADLEELPAKGPLPPLTRVTTGARGRFRGGGSSSKEGKAGTGMARRRDPRTRGGIDEAGSEGSQRSHTPPEHLLPCVRASVRPPCTLR